MSTAASSSSTTTHAQKLAQRTIHTLMNDFGFALERCREAVEAISDKGDVSLAISWLLDHGEQDRGGAIALKRCPHLDYADGTRPLAHPSRLRFGCPCKEGCTGSENWICLFCGERLDPSGNPSFFSSFSRFRCSFSVSFGMNFESSVNACSKAAPHHARTPLLSGRRCC